MSAPTALAHPSTTSTPPAPPLTVLLGPPPATVHTSPETAAAVEAQSAAERALRGLEQALHAVSTRHAAAIEAADPGAIRPLSREKRRLEEEVAAAKVTAARAAGAALSRQVLDAQQVIAPLADYATRARAIVAERETAFRAAERFWQEASGAAQNAQARYELLSERWAHAQRAAKTAGTALAQHLADAATTDAGPRAPVGRM